LLITRPVSRMNVVSSKFIAGFIYTALLVTWLAILSLGLGIIIFGVGELIVVRSSGIIIFALNDIFWRFLGAYGFAILSMTVVTSLAFLFSSLVENAIGPIISTMAIIIVFLILSAIQIDFFENLKPYLFTSYMSSWRLFFDDPVDYHTLTQSVLILLVHITVFFGAAAIIFKRKDILT
ncbi:MAG TPA: hypothetical protein VLB50_08010, partial [Ignavibacteriaceae bacterium]|nr:hypothetical protein [Ignavibacteriaceae bacterium]